MKTIKTGLRTVAVGAGVIALGFGAFAVYWALRGVSGATPWNRDVFELITALSVGAAGFVCIWAGMTGRGEHMGRALARIDAASEAAARREAEGLRRQREALARQRASAHRPAELE